MAERDPVVVPVTQEEAQVSKKEVQTGVVRVRKLVREHVEQIDERLLHDEVDIEHIPVNRVVDAPAPPREEGDLLIADPASRAHRAARRASAHRPKQCQPRGDCRWRRP